jgi:starvation-inducible DNA-binding protein
MTNQDMSVMSSMPMTMNPSDLVDMMRIAFANNFTWYLQSHNYHFNIMGKDFPQYHKFLNDIYSDAQENIDTYGEKVRQLGAFDLGAYPEIISLSILQDPQSGLTDPAAMFAQLISDNDTIISYLQDTYDCAGMCREYGIQNFLADRIDSHRQTQWMLKAIVG